MHIFFDVHTVKCTNLFLGEVPSQLCRALMSFTHTSVITVLLVNIKPGYCSLTSPRIATYQYLHIYTTTPQITRPLTYCLNSRWTGWWWRHGLPSADPRTACAASEPSPAPDPTTSSAHPVCSAHHWNSMYIMMSSSRQTMYIMMSSSSSRRTTLWMITIPCTWLEDALWFSCS